MIFPYTHKRLIIAMSLAQFLNIYSHIVFDEEYAEDFGIFTIKKDISRGDVAMRTDWFPAYNIDMELAEFMCGSGYRYLRSDDKIIKINFPLTKKNLAPFLKGGREITLCATFEWLEPGDSLEKLSLDVLHLKRKGKKLLKRVERFISFSDESCRDFIVTNLGNFLRRYSPTREILIRAFGALPLPRDIKNIVYGYIGEV